ncbi:MAG: AAA family ATPase [Candidatus Omnitrophica bacterium]|nr:AAA family ATPase [Candidatus Omnitrophota bacterium]
MYLDFYKLRENPFNVTSDPSFLYMSETHKEALAHLVFGIQHRKGFIVLTGEVGAGKTTLCRALEKKLDASVKTSIIFNPALSENQLMESILADFDIVPQKKNKGNFIKSLNSFLLDCLRDNNNVVLIIDESQNLKKSSLETIRMLSNLETEKEKLLQIVLIGQPELKEKLDHPNLRQLKQRVAVRFHLDVLNAKEIKEYLYHRLNVAGSDGRIVFEDDTVNIITNYTKGIPRLINVIADKSLLLGFAKNTNYIYPDLVKQAINETEGIFAESY